MSEQELHSADMEYVIRSAFALARDKRLPYSLRNHLWKVAQAALAAKDFYEEKYVEAQNIGVRNPEFDGDWVGRPTDDFED